jgi:hypothetical protein
LGHISADRIRNLIANDLVTGITLDDKGGKMAGHCGGCAKGKLHRLPLTTQKYRKTYQPLEKMYANVCGPFPPGIIGFKYMLIFIDTM